VRRPGGKKPLESAQAVDPRAAYSAAVALLARRDYSRVELSRKLADRGFSTDAVTQALAELGESRLLDDSRYGANVVAYRARRGQGPARIRNELRRAGVAAETVESALATDADSPDFVALAREARRRKFGDELPKDWKARAKQARFLQYRGFSTDHIRAVLEGDPEIDSGPDVSEPS
jgi:regulatory protein